MDTMMSPTQYLDDVLEGNESEEELYSDEEELEEGITKEFAILSWLSTFPQVNHGDVHIFVKEWYENKAMSR